MPSVLNEPDGFALAACIFRHGRARRGQRVHELRHWPDPPDRLRRISLIAARFEGGDFAAPFLLKGTCGVDTLNRWLEVSSARC
ncbi:MAG: hypothetical protein KDJ54_10630 [Candidatus Competibacteraceae bacterium]|nr:hypothetical protein [Candidatus Competibacteraceae bacterium]